MGEKVSEIRAFIGHSFADEDKALVTTFLEYFTQISKSNPMFTWEHAQSAEPKQLAEKVLSLISTKNVFIGICTRKECVVDLNSLKTAFFDRGCLKAPKTSLLWKASDWIIQEIGLAKGKGIPVLGKTRCQMSIK